MTHLPILCGHEPFFTSFYLSGPWIEASCRLTTDSFICNSTFYLGISIQIMIEIEEALWLAADDVDKKFDQSDCTFRYWILLGRRRLLWHDSIYASPTTITTTIATFCRKFACYNTWSKKITGCDGDRSLLTLEDSRSNLAINIFIKEYLYRELST